MGVEGDWIKEVFVKKVGNGGNTSFWHDVWCGLGTLREAFPRLFQLSLHPEATIKDFGEWENGSWRWHFEWRRSFFVWEESLCGQLMDVLASISLSHNDDVWEFRPDRGGTYTVKENYLFLCHSFGPSSSLGLETSRLVEGVWTSWAPSKVVAMFLSFFHSLKPSKKVQKEVVMLWQVVVWVIWKTRNVAIFSRKTHGIHEVVEKIKRLSWQWLLAKKNRSPCLYYDWCVQPIYCLAS
jgi:hypothetical protein